MALFGWRKSRWRRLWWFRSSQGAAVVKVWGPWHNLRIQLYPKGSLCFGLRYRIREPQPPQPWYGHIYTSAWCLDLMRLALIYWKVENKEKKDAPRAPAY